MNSPRSPRPTPEPASAKCANLRVNVYSLKDHPSEASDAAAQALSGEEVVLLPTDTVYGLAAMPTSSAAVNRLFELKRRPSDVSVAMLVADPSDVAELAEDPPEALVKLAQLHWPGPLTVVLPRRKTLNWALGGSGGTLGLRCPDNDWLRGLLRRVGPLAVTSANLHGKPTPPTVGEVLKTLRSGVSVAVDGGRLTGEASTVVRWLDGEVEILRQGSLRIGKGLGL